MLYFEIISLEEFILLEDVSLMTFRYTFKEEFMLLEDFAFMKLGKFSREPIKDKHDS